MVRALQYRRLGSDVEAAQPRDDLQVVAALGHALSMSAT
jgi:hypothetical protein